MGFDQYLRQSNSQQQGASTLSPLSDKVFGSASTAIGAATKYLSAAGTATAASSQVVLDLVTHASTLQNLYANASTAPAGTDTLIFTVQTSTDNGGTWTDSALTCTITGTAKAASDTTHAVAVAAGTLIAIKVVSSGATGAGISAACELA